MTENVMGVLIEVNSGFMGLWGYSLYFTNERVIQSKINEVQKNLISTQLGVEYKEWIKDSTQGLERLDPDKIFASDNHNIAIPYSSIKTIKLYKPLPLTKSRSQIAKIEIQTEDKNYTFSFHRFNFDRYMQIVKQVMADKPSITLDIPS